MGRHSVPDDYDDDAPAVLSGPPVATGRPRPGRHSGEHPEPAGRPAPLAIDDPADDRAEGLDMIETVMSGTADDVADHVADGVADNTADDAVETDDRQQRSAVGRGGGPEYEGHTEQIEPIVDPVLDEPLPVAVTTLIPPVVDGDTPPPRPQPGTPPADGPVEQRPDESGAASDPKAAKANEKAAAKAARAAAKAAAKADKAARSAAKSAGSASGEDLPATNTDRDADVPASVNPSRPQPRVSDLALLRADSAARARVVAAIVVPFLLYVGVLLVLGAFDLRTVLIWIWLPLITAGIVAGLLLDLAHRAAAARAIAALEPPRETAANATTDPGGAGR